MSANREDQILCKFVPINDFAAKVLVKTNPTHREKVCLLRCLRKDGVEFILECTNQALFSIAQVCEQRWYIFKIPGCFMFNRHESSTKHGVLSQATASLLTTLQLSPSPISHNVPLPVNACDFGQLDQKADNKWADVGGKVAQMPEE